MIATLFDETPEAVEVVEKPKHIDWHNMTAHRVNKLPDGWRWFSIDCHNKPEGFYELKGAVPIGVVARGKRKGSPKWPPMAESTTLWMKFSDLEETKRLWEQETGKCVTCTGTGQEFTGWSATDGSKFAPCKKCSGTGLKMTDS